MLCCVIMGLLSRGRICLIEFMLDSAWLFINSYNQPWNNYKLIGSYHSNMSLPVEILHHGE